VNLRQTTFVLAVVLIGLSVSGCSGIKSYANQGVRNMSIESRTEYGSFFSRVKASVDIYDAFNPCEMDYLGAVPLNSDSEAVALPLYKPLYLRFLFSTSGLLANTRGSVTLGTLFVAEPHRTYRAQVSYLNSMYSVQLWAGDSGGSQPIDLVPLPSCRSTG